MQEYVILISLLGTACNPAYKDGGFKDCNFCVCHSDGVERCSERDCSGQQGSEGL